MEPLAARTQIAADLRQEIIVFRKLPLEPAGHIEEQDLLRLLARYRYDVIDQACSALQGAVNDPRLPSVVGQKEAIEQHLKAQSPSMAIASLTDSYIRQSELVLDLSASLFEVSKAFPPETQPYTLHELSETVYVANGQLEAETVHLFLNSFGIPSRILQESAGIVLALTVGPMGEADVRVAPDVADQARILLQEMKEGVFMLSDFEEMVLGIQYPDEALDL